MEVKGVFMQQFIMEHYYSINIDLRLSLFLYLACFFTRIIPECLYPTDKYSDSEYILFLMYLLAIIFNGINLKNPYTLGLQLLKKKKLIYLCPGSVRLNLVSKICIK